jgi:hypothetical protein
VGKTISAMCEFKLFIETFEEWHMNMTLKNLVKDTTAEFLCYRDGDLWYRITGKQLLDAGSNQEFTFEFPVPVTDTGTGVFPAQVKAITLMRWVRKHFEKIQKGEWR